MSRRRIAALLALFAAAVPAPALAQGRAQDGATGSPPERIDLTITRPPSVSTEEACRRQREAAIVSGEIVVCGSAPAQDQRLGSREEAQRRHAEETAFRDDPATPDVAGPGIFRGPATVSGICVKGIFNCPRPPALMVDVTKLPQAPPGSDADRIARGLEPLGNDGPEAPRQLTAQERAELGLPEPAAGPAVNPAGSGEPGARP